ncbi:MAG: hypothetical protein ICV55_13100 [Coleofasciculus sp. C3-bin4]|jgi:hypothetical protein|nr:hypothetical protein [Coleofasciculus sp. C3-bin4]
MLPMFLILLVSALGSILVSLLASHEIPRILSVGSAIFCSLFGFAMAPWPVQLLIFILILRLELLYPLIHLVVLAKNRNLSNPL